MARPATPDRRDTIPPGLLEELCSDPQPRVRAAEVARALRAVKIVSLDDSKLIDEITARMLDVAGW